MAYPTTSIQSCSDRAISNWNHRCKFINICICTLREHCSSAWKFEDITLKLHPILDGLLDGQAFVRNISIVDIVPAFRPGKWSRIPFGCWNKTMQLFLFGGTMPLSLYRIFPWEGHSSVLFLTRSIISVSIITRLKHFGLWLRRINYWYIIVMRFKIQCGKDIITVFLLGNF